MKNSENKKVEGNIAVFEDLGIYSRDPVKDKEINKRIIKFLEKQGVKLGKIKLKKMNRIYEGQGMLFSNLLPPFIHITFQIQKSPPPPRPQQNQLNLGSSAPFYISNSFLGLEFSEGFQVCDLTLSKGLAGFFCLARSFRKTSCALIFWFITQNQNQKVYLYRIASLTFIRNHYTK